MIGLVMFIVVLIMLLLLEPILYLLLGISVILVVWLSFAPKANNYYGLLWLTIAGVIMDVITKSALGTYIISGLILYYSFYLLKKYIPENNTFITLLIYMISFILSLSILKIFRNESISINMVYQTIFPSFISTILSLILSQFQKIFISDISNNSLKIK